MYRKAEERGEIYVTLKDPSGKKCSPQRYKASQEQETTDSPQNLDLCLLLLLPIRKGPPAAYAFFAILCEKKRHKESNEEEHMYVTHLPSSCLALLSVSE